MPHFMANGLKHFYEDTETGGGVLVLLHGFGQHGRLCWGDHIDQYARFFRVLTLDMRGCGRTELAPPGFTTEDLASDIVALLDHLGVEKAHFGGWSLGGFVGVQLGVSHSDRLLTLALHNALAGGGRTPQGALWMGARARMIALGERELGAAMRVHGYFGADFINERQDLVDKFMKRELANEYPATDAGTKAQLAVAPQYDARQKLHKITVPTLVTTGSVDRTVLPAQSKALHEGIKGSEFVIFDGAGHFPIYQCAGEFASLTIGFMLKHAAS